MNRRYFCFTLLFCIGLQLFVSNCSKVKHTIPSHKFGPYALGEVKDYLYLKPGSYWINKNNVTGETDTITTLSIDTSVKTASSVAPTFVSEYTYTYLQFVQYSSHLKGTINNAMFAPPGTRYSVSINRDYVLNGKQLGYNYFQYPLIPVTDTTKSYNASASFFGMPKNVVSGSYTFDSAAQLRICDFMAIPVSHICKKSIRLSDHYFVKHIGLVKIHTRSYYPETQETWVLVDYSIKL